MQKYWNKLKQTGNYCLQQYLDAAIIYHYLNQQINLSAVGKSLP